MSDLRILMDNDQKSSPELQRDNLRVIKVLGKGATGTVILVHDKSSRIPFALKVVEKSSTLQFDSRARREISVLSRLSSPDHHPFLPHLIGVFENEEIVCYGTPYCPGGDLNVLRHHQNDRVFSPAAIRFYLAEIVCALEHLHEQGIVYRDLKPENILLQQSGHVTLTDFDLSRDLNHTKHADWRPKSDREEQKKLPRFLNILKKARSARISPVSRRNHLRDFNNNERSNSFVGTEEYVAPEVILGDGHEFSVDWWALGVLCYEMLYGITPFKGKNRKETFGKILFANPKYMGKPCALTDMIVKLLEKNPTRRLGYRSGACEIKEHEFFTGLRWDLLTEVLRPPFIPLREELEMTGGGMDVREYFLMLEPAPSPLFSPSMDERPHNVSLTEF